MTGHDPEIALLVELLDRSYDTKGWQGPILRGSIRGLSAKQAAWRPDSRRHNIAEQVLHAAYWKYAVRRRLRDEPRGSFGIKGSNWFPVAEGLTEADWKGHVRLLETEHRTLRETLSSFPSNRLREIPPGGKVTYLETILGIAAHDAYHTGQIQLLKRLLPGELVTKG